jgi:hypothetical protein
VAVRCQWIDANLDVLVALGGARVHVDSLAVGAGTQLSYIACTLIEAIAFINLIDPLRWYAFNAVFAILASLVFVVDRDRMIRQRQSAAAGPAEEELYRVIIRVRRGSNDRFFRVPDLRLPVLCQNGSDNSEGKSGGDRLTLD